MRAFLLLLALGALTAGCRAAPPRTAPAQTPAAAATATAGPITLTLWHGETGAARDELETLAREFHAANPDLTVTPMYVGGEGYLAKQVMAAIALGHAPDLVLAARRDIAEFARQGGAQPLDVFSNDPQTGLTTDDNTDFWPGLMDEGKFPEFGNKLYALPFDEEALVLYYDTDLLQNANLNPPPTSWDDFSNMAGKSTQDQDYGWAMQADADLFAALVAGQNGAVVDGSEHHARFGEASGVTAMTLVSQLAKSGAAHSNEDSDASAQDFAQGRAAFLMDWMTRRADIQAAQKLAGAHFTIGVASLPQADPKNAGLLIRGFDLAILTSSPERARDAWVFMRWATAARQTAEWARAADAIPLRAAAMPLLTGGGAPPLTFQQILASLGGSAPHFLPRPANPRIAAVEQLIVEAWAQIVSNKADVQATLSAASQRADQLLVSAP